MAFWLGAFSKIQIMFTIPPTYIKGAFFGKVRGQIQIFKVYLHSSLSFNSRGNKQNLRQGLKNLYSSTYTKVNFGEKLRCFSKKLSLNSHRKCRN